jgi:hypothetical protein
MIEPLARLGYTSEALVCAVSGGLAAAAAFERGGAVTDTSGALRVILTRPFGNAILIMSRAIAGRVWSGRSGTLRIAVFAALAGLLSHPGGSASAQSAANLLPVGVRYRADNGADVSRRDLEEMQRLRFNVIELAARTGERDKRSLVFIHRLLAGAPDPRVLLELDTPPATITVAAGSRGAEVATAAWSALARGNRGVIFADWAALLDNPDALAAAAEFAEAIARNAALYAPLRPVSTTNGDERRVRISGDRSAVEATLLESPEALVLIAVNRSAREQRSTMAFSPDVPEAIWQNMLAGSAVNFVAGSEGPMYERTFAPDEVVVLVIRKDRR